MSRKLKDGIYLIKVHGIESFIKMIDSEPYIAEYVSKKKEYLWVPTMIVPERLKRAKLMNDAELVLYKR